MSSSADVAASSRKLDLEWVRGQFPSLHQSVNSQPAVFFDAPGGTQVPQRVIDAVAEYLANSNANTGGAFVTSRRTDQMISSARAAMADFLNCATDEIVFGPNMSTLTFALSRAIARELKAGDELLVTCLDHDANVSPWLSLEERGVKVRTVDIRLSDCTLDMFDLSAKVRRNTRLVAIGWAANAVGTINDVPEIVRRAHATDLSIPQRVRANSFKKKWYLLKRQGRGTLFLYPPRPRPSAAPRFSESDRYDESRISE